MQNNSAFGGLDDVEAARVSAAARFGQEISRASIARAGGINEGQLWRGLDGRAKTRVETVAKAAGGLLTRIIDVTSEEDFALPDNFPGRVEEASAAVAYAIKDAMGATGDANARRRLKARLATLDELLTDTVHTHFRVAKAMALLAHEWLSGEAGHGVRLGATGAAIAIVNARPIGKAEAAHV